MQQPEVPSELVAIIKSAASERGFNVAHDTHYDGFDWEVRWWTGRTLHRLNFQPWLEEKVLISQVDETYPPFPRVIRWLSRFVPFFPHLAEITASPKGEFGPGLAPEDYRERVHQLLQNAA